MDCSPSDSSIHGILQARILEWVPISFSRESSQPRDWTEISHNAGRFFTIWATREAQIPSGKKPFFFFFLCSREVWPERDVFGAQDISPEEEIQLLKQILWAPLPRESPFPSHHSPSHASLAPTSQIPGNPHSFCRPAGAGGTRGRGRRRRRGGGGRVRSGPGVGERI